MNSAPETTPAVQVTDLRRTYGKGSDAFEAVRGIDVTVERGSIVALLGTNGAGKTSTLEVIEGLAPATGGEVKVLGLDPRKDRAEVRRHTGVLLQESGFPGDLTVAETLAMWSATVTGARPIEQTLDRLDLMERRNVKVRSLSGGETRRLDLACTLAGDPELVFLDEPTTGLDPQSRHRVWDLVRELRQGGTTVLMTTHYLEEAEALAERIAIMHRGEIVRDGTPAQITADQPATIKFGTPAQPLPDLPHVATDSDGGLTVLRTRELQSTLHQLLDWAATTDTALERLDARTATLESAFLAIARDDADTPSNDQFSLDQFLTPGETR